MSAPGGTNIRLHVMLEELKMTHHLPRFLAEEIDDDASWAECLRHMLADESSESMLRPLAAGAPQAPIPPSP